MLYTRCHVARAGAAHLETELADGLAVKTRLLRGSGGRELYVLYAKVGESLGTVSWASANKVAGEP